ncbi:fungal specific transcription factor domain-containing protein [Colletotrichum melonis]|uniref:Fungal specific transcription factor domain-containing protein n=1 Tax=Colletotrichum melonis TaxID=1209925 RepID=A0AAI9UAW7_9PEZI|nr:fungal specific transcription factor domain-containing protein [Colletotrichum melonis]
MEKNQKRISCKRCQQRKIRCSRTFPCTNCSTASAKCEVRESDFKRPPVSREYVAALESRIASLESLLGNLKAADGDERNQILDDLEVQDYVPSFSGLPLADEIALSEAMTKASFQEMTDGSMIYHGPTSIFQNEVSTSMYPTSSSTASKPSAFHEDKANLTNQTMRLCIGLFFFWQYPLFMFIDREAFIQEFEENPVDGNFCSPPLIYACAALGALMSKDPEVRPRAQEFANTAQTILTTDELGISRPTSVQAWLCLAYYETGLSNMSKSWLYTGMAFRMGQDLGLQRDPTHWGPEEKPNEANPFPFNNEFRRRIYWGSFLTDKMFSLFLGRPTFMYENDADVNINEPLPHDPPIWENWLFSHDLGFLKTMRPAGPKLTLLFNQQIELARIVHDMLSQTFAPKKMKDPAARRWNEVSLNKLNARLVAWHEALPTNMRWKKWFTNKDILQPNVSILHMFYHSTRICLNLPFLASVRHVPSTADLADNDDDDPETSSNNPIIKSLRICQSSAQGIADVLQRFKSQHTLGNAPLIFVGATIVATNVVLVTTRRQRGGGGVPQLMKDTLLPVFDGALEDMSASYKLAEEARAKVRVALNTKEQHRYDAGGGQQSEVVPVGVDGETARSDEPVAVVVDPALSGSVLPPVTTAIGSGSTTETAEIPSFMSPEQQGWQPLSVLDGETAFWGNLGNDIFAGSELEYLDGVTEFDWTDRPPIP